MSNLVKILIFCTFISGVTLWVVYFNGDTATIKFSSTKQLQAPAGIIFIGVFVFGAVCAALFATLFGIKSYFRERQLKNKERKRVAFDKGLLDARGRLASHDWDGAREAWQTIVKKDPTDIIARIELSRSLEGAGQLREALKTLDVARSADNHNIEVLFRAAELNMALGNKTAAVDNLALILYNHPSPRAAELARNLSEELGRHEDALEYQEKLEKLGQKQDSDKVRSRLEYHKLLSDHVDKPEELIVALRKFIRRHEHVEAFQHLANLLSERNETEEAVQHLINAGRISGNHEYWRAASRLWIDNGNPERALAAARTSAKDTTGLGRLHAELELIRTYMGVANYEAAKKAIDDFPELAKSQEMEAPQEVNQQLLVLTGFCNHRAGDYRAAADCWKKLSKYDFDSMEKTAGKAPKLNGHAPEPRLSTP